MRKLHSTESQAVSGGAVGEALCVIGFGTAALLTLDAFYSPPYFMIAHNQPYYYDIVTPVYDQNGFYQGDIVDTYVMDNTYSQVTYY